MTTLFVSHSGTDRELTASVRLWLKDAGYGSLFVDFDPADGIAPGRRWETELYAQLRKADAVVFATAASTVAHVLRRGEPGARVGPAGLPVRVEPGATLDLLNHCQWVDLAEGDTALVRLRAALEEAGLGPEPSLPWDRTRSPYSGLVPFEAADAAVFFGREDELGRLLALLAPTPMQPSGRFVAILGPSGSGKSSLMRAGLLPRSVASTDRGSCCPPAARSEPHTATGGTPRGGLCRAWRQRIDGGRRCGYHSWSERPEAGRRPSRGEDRRSRRRATRRARRDRSGGGATAARRAEG